MKTRFFMVLGVAVLFCAGASYGQTNLDFSPAGFDVFDSQMQVRLDGGLLGGPVILQLQGPTAVQRTDPFPDSGKNTIETEIVSMQLTGSSLFGEVRIGLDPDRSSIGRIQSVKPAPDFPAESIFDVFFQVEIPGIGTLVNEDPLRVKASGLHVLPPRVRRTEVPRSVESDFCLGKNQDRHSKSIWR